MSSDTIKITLTNRSIITFPDPIQDYVLYTDISKHSLSGLLTQEKVAQINGKDTTSCLSITYVSDTSVGLQMNWMSLTKEGDEIYMSFKKLSSYLYNARIDYMWPGTFTQVPYHSDI